MNEKTPINYFEIVSNFVDDRPVMRHHNASFPSAIALLSNELQELIASSDKDRGGEIVDIVWLALTIAHLQGIDFDDEFRTKFARNVLKRPAKNWQAGDYDDIDQKARKDWKESGGDKEFYD